ncbi:MULTISPECIES: hypothetical protein [Dyella]|uniref:RES domain-containing protein n=2 Tax=Dyella TaxID=231454 RepID=A0A4R0YGL4_9GAMM|nr:MULTISPECIES: hypothetical protein [Dyella]TBR36062.1 hypothetical protein EYV96_15755 [Dyella terrae]TCI06112.1 hypothetical protein EZM97_34850 [Dyella soli]
MASSFELSLFEQELIEVKALPEAARWTLERDDTVPLGLRALMHPAKHPSDRYMAQLHWGGLFNPASLKFLNLETRADNDPTAWPQCYGFRPANLDACVSWTQEGHRLHPEWAQSGRAAFRQPERPVRFALLQLQHELDTTYVGRGRA